MIYNPPEIAQWRENESKEGTKTEGEKEKSVLDRKVALQVAVKMEKVIPVFIQQLKMLLGVSASNEWVCGLDYCNDAIFLGVQYKINNHHAKWGRAIYMYM
jgi:hypothetical protein